MLYLLINKLYLLLIFKFYRLTNNIQDIEHSILIWNDKILKIEK